MYIYKDVYGRQVNVGDYVLAFVSYPFIYSNYKLFNTPIDYEWESINGLAINHASIERVGYEKVDFHNENNIVYCYKIEDINLYQYLNNFDYSNWYSIYDQASVPVENCMPIHHEILDILGRKVNAGDIVIYGLRKTKPVYGVVLDKKTVVSATGKVERLNACFKVETFSVCEDKELEKLKKGYQNYISMQSSYKEIDLKDSKFGDIILSPDNKTLYVCIGKLSFKYIYDNNLVSTESPLTETYYIPFSTSKKFTKKMMEDLKSGLKIDLNNLMLDCMSTISEYLKNVIEYQSFVPYYDDNFLAHMMSLYPNITWGTYFAGKEYFYYIERFNTMDSTYFIRKDGFKKKKKNLLFSSDGLYIDNNCFSFRHHDMEMFIYFH